MIDIEVLIQDKFITFPELLVYFEFRLVFTARHVLIYLPRWRASRLPITSVEFKFVTKQVLASVAIRAAKLKFVVESSLLCATCCPSMQHCILLRNKLVTNVAISATTRFNLQCNNVARQFEEKYCPYYQTFKPQAIRCFCFVKKHFKYSRS